jgi:predicted NAD/FAD-dependent oxidoreductase
MHFAIIGAGMAGLACADGLQTAGHRVTLFDKGRGPGGRMSTRRLETRHGTVAFDHGAQYFTARDPRFVQLVRAWSEAGIASPWPLAGADAWVGVPGMNEVVRRMAAAHKVEWDHLVTSLARKETSWWLTGRRGETGPFDAVVLAIPAEQALPMLSLHDFAMGRTALNARSQPCWTGMFVFHRPLDGLAPVVRNAGEIAWAARNSAKPGRASAEAWVVQASGSWSCRWLEASPQHISTMLLAALARAAGRKIPEPVAATAHRWRYALSPGTGDGALWNEAIALGACGDWLLGPRVECAWISGRTLAERCTGVARPAGVAITSANTRLGMPPKVPVTATCPKGQVNTQRMSCYATENHQ